MWKECLGGCVLFGPNTLTRHAPLVRTQLITVSKSINLHKGMACVLHGDSSAISNCESTVELQGTAFFFKDDWHVAKFLLSPRH